MTLVEIQRLINGTGSVAEVLKTIDDNMDRTIPVDKSIEENEESK